MSDRRKNTGGFFVLKERIKKFLNALSGNDLASMLHDVLESKIVAELQLKYMAALKNLSDSVNDPAIVKPKMKHHFVRPLRLAGISLNESKTLGFKFGETVWRSCLNTNERHLGGRPGVSSEFVDDVRNHMENLSNIAVNRNIIKRTYSPRDPHFIFKKKKLEQTYVSARYRQTTYREAFRKFINNNELRPNTKFSTFYKNIDNRFKKPYRLTDLCDYCEMGKILEKDIRKFTETNEFRNEFLNFDINLSTTNLIAYFENQLSNRRETEHLFLYDNDINNLIEKIHNLKTIEFHKSIDNLQFRI